MYKVVVVDDEKWIVEGIKAGVDWAAHGFEVIGDAENGQEALRLIENLQPDVVLTDIKMPVLNGLELIKKGKSISPSTLFVVLSGHAEFAYAQKALNYGTFGYCLKPFEIEELHSMLDRLSQTLRTSRSPSKPSYSHELYEAICSGEVQHMKLLLEENGMTIDTRSMAVTLVVQSSEQIDIDQGIPHLRFKMNRKRHGYLLHEGQTAEFLHKMRQQFGIREYSIGVGTPFSHVSELEASLEVATLTAYGDFATGRKGIYYPSRSSDSSIEGRLKEIIRALDQKDRVHFVTSLDSTRGLFHQGTLNMKDAYLIYTAVMYLFNREGMMSNGRFFEGYEQLYYHFGSADAMLDYLIQHTQEYFSDSSAARIANVSHKRIKEILMYIHDNFNQEISIQSLSDKFYLSSNYLCQLFKKEVGDNFVEYLSQLRIQYACKLLSTSDLPIKEIGEKCGFNDYFYFTRIFKRINHMTPTQYREKQAI